MKSQSLVLSVFLTLSLVTLLPASISIYRDSCYVTADSFETVDQKMFMQSKNMKITACSPNSNAMMTFKEVRKRSTGEYFTMPIKDQITQNSNPFIASLYFAFATHKRITLSPDMIWLIICQGAATHISLNPEKYKPLFTQSTLRQQLEVRVDALTNEASDPHWITAISGLSAQLETRMNKQLYNLFTPKFSTTGTVEQAAFQLTLMNSASNYYDFTVATMCGIPEIKLEGTKEDWQELSNRIDQLTLLNMNWWTPHLRTIIDQFLAAYNGTIDHEFWNSIVKSKGMSGGPFLIDGWVKDLYPYVLDEKGFSIKNPYLGDNEIFIEPTGDENPPAEYWEQKRKWERKGLKVAAFSDGVQKTPFLWNYLGTKRKMIFYSGFIGVSYSNETNMLKPEIGYLVGEHTALKAKIERTKK